MTGATPHQLAAYLARIGFVGKTLGKYTIYVGGNVQGTRLGFIYKDLIPQADLVPALTPLLHDYKANRHGNESFGDYCTRQGHAALPQS